MRQERLSLDSDERRAGIQSALLGAISDGLEAINVAELVRVRRPSTVASRPTAGQIASPRCPPAVRARVETPAARLSHRFCGTSRVFPAAFAFSTMATATPEVRIAQVRGLRPITRRIFPKEFDISTPILCDRHAHPTRSHSAIRRQARFSREIWHSLVGRGGEPLRCPVARRRGPPRVAAPRSAKNRPFYRSFR